jgi:hypothetical protein
MRAFEKLPRLGTSRRSEIGDFVKSFTIIFPPASGANTGGPRLVHWVIRPHAVDNFTGRDV